MPIKHIGRNTDFRGKTLWEILGNLKNFGINRIVARNMFQRYPEPSYIKIMKVEALPNCKPSYDEQRKVIALVDKTFRGMKQKTLVQMESVTYKADYILVPKRSESEFCQTIKTREIKILPFGMEFPPLLKEFVVRPIKMSTPAIKEPKMKIIYNKTGLKTYRVAKEGETPTEPEPSIGLGKPVAPRLYKDLKL